MGLSRSRTLYLIALIALIAFALRPVKEVDLFFDRAFAPARVIGALASPLKWLGATAVRAAETSIESEASALRQKSRVLLLDEQAWARPSDPTLLQGRGMIAVQVGERAAANDRDRIKIRGAPDCGLDVGMPVVCGDVYVGRVASVDPAHPGQGEVALVTGKNFRVGARVDECELVVGSLAPPPADERQRLYLAVQTPSSRSIEAGLVRVYEPDAVEVEPYRKLADGYLLGELRRYRVHDVQTLGVRASLDYADGLYQAVVLAPQARGDSAALLAQDPFDDACWLASEFVLQGEPSFWRAGRKLAAGSRAGLGQGSAVAAGARFLGRIVRLGPWTSDVALLGDPGLVLSVLAAIDGEARPIVLGRLVSLERDRRDGSVSLEWDTSVPIRVARAGDGPIEVVLYTGSGERGVPPGLVIGTTRLPRTSGRCVLRVQLAEPQLHVRHVRVWRDANESLRGDRS